MEMQSIEEALSYIISTKGINVLINGNLCFSLLNDLIPKQKDKLVLIKHAFNNDAIKDITTANDSKERQKAINKMYDYLYNQVRLREDAALEICDVFIIALKWDVLPPNVDYNEYTIQSPPKVVKTPTALLIRHGNGITSFSNKKHILFALLIVLIISVLIYFAYGLTKKVDLNNSNPNTKNSSVVNTDEINNKQEIIKEAKVKADNGNYLEAKNTLLETQELYPNDKEIENLILDYEKKHYDSLVSYALSEYNSKHYIEAVVYTVPPEPSARTPRATFTE